MSDTYLVNVNKVAKNVLSIGQLRLLNLCIETVNKAVFEVMGGNIFTDK